MASYHLLVAHLGWLRPLWQYAKYVVKPQARQWLSVCKLITYNASLLMEETSPL